MVNGEAGVYIKELAYENTNAACQNAINPFQKEGDINDCFHLCSNIGPCYTYGLSLGAALQGQTAPQLCQKMVAITLGRARELFPLVFIIHYTDNSLFVVENNRILEDLFAEGKKWINPLWVDYNF